MSAVDERAHAGSGERPGRAGFLPVFFRHAGMHWEAHPAAENAIRGLGGWRTLAGLGFERLQDKPDHAVWRGELAIGGVTRPVIVKTSRVRRFHLHVLHLVGPTRAAREWRSHRRALEAGLPVVMPFALGERRRFGAPFESVLVSEAWPHDATLQDLARAGEGAPLEVLLGELGAAVHRMHEAGLFHGDLHPGNVLVRLTGADRLRVIDWKHVNWRSTRGGGAEAQLAKLVFQFRSANVFRTDAPEHEDAFYEGFVRAGGDAALRPRVGAAVRGTAERLAARAARRCLEDNSTFAVQREGKFTLHVRREPGIECLDPALRRPEALVALAEEGEGTARAGGSGRVRVERCRDARDGWRNANRAHALDGGASVPLAWIERADVEGPGWIVWLEPAAG